MTRYFFSTAYLIVALLITVLIALQLQSGSDGIYVFVRDDLLTDLNRLAFVCGLPIAYLVSSLACHFLVKMPQFDFFNRILVINLIVYGFFGLVLSASRIQLYSRTVMLSEFIVTTILLMAFHFIRHRVFPKNLGILPIIDIKPFKAYPYLRVTAVTVESSEAHKFDGIIADLRKGYDAKTSHFLSVLAQKKIPIYHANTLIETLWGRIPLVELTAAEIDSFIPSQFYASIKRGAELIIVFLLLPLLATLSVVICLAIALDTGRPILFKQTRAGQYGTSFTMLKFRSMHDSEKRHDQHFTENNDRRITRVGRFLRRLRLDELPQMWNVLKGEMSLIGPRPEQLPLTARFNKIIPFYSFRHMVRPGITGWAQVMYGYASSDDQTRAKLEFDFFYIKHMSAWLDLVIYVKTIRAVLIGSGGSGSL